MPLATKTTSAATASPRTPLSNTSLSAQSGKLYADEVMWLQHNGCAGKELYCGEQIMSIRSSLLPFASTLAAESRDDPYYRPVHDEIVQVAQQLPSGVGLLTDEVKPSYLRLLEKLKSDLVDHGLVHCRDDYNCEAGRL